MEAIALDRSISINKQIKNNNNNLKKKIQSHHHYHHQQHLHTNNMMIDHNFIQSQPLSNKDIDMMLMKINMMHGHNYHGNMHGGVFLNPHANYPMFHRSTSLPPPHHHHHLPPPLLPLPATAKSSFSSLPPPIRRRSSLCSPPSGPTSKKPSKKQQHVGKKATKVNEGDVEQSNKRVGPDPDEIFSLSPPPSSLPLPRFSLTQPKRSCTAEAVVVDDGAHAGVVADNLSRILRIQ